VAKSHARPIHKFGAALGSRWGANSARQVRWRFVDVSAVLVRPAPPWPAPSPLSRNCCAGRHAPRRRDYEKQISADEPTLTGEATSLDRALVI